MKGEKHHTANKILAYRKKKKKLDSAVIYFKADLLWKRQQFSQNSSVILREAKGAVHHLPILTIVNEKAFQVAEQS